MVDANAVKATSAKVDGREYRLFRSLDVDRRGKISVGDLLDAFERTGLYRDDQRISETMASLATHGVHEELSYDEFVEIIRPNILLVEQALQGNVILPDFEDFCGLAEGIYLKTKEIGDGHVADYIPQLGRVDPELYGLALCTIDGQQFALGDHDTDFCVQSCCKPISYCLALEEHGEEMVHHYVGREPSGRNFNELTLNEDGRPHNPMINAGAIMCSSLISPQLDPAERFDLVLEKWQALGGNRKVNFNNSIYQSERQTGDRNYALGYYMRENRAFPEGTDLMQTLEFYFQCCSIETNVTAMATLAATLANGGVCPTTGERVLKTSNVRHCLSLMCSCGMYDFSGEFAFEVGLPAKSGVSGVLLVVVPNVMGVCVWAPRLDARGNSVRGIEFCKQLVQTFNFYNYDNLTGFSEKIDPRLNRIETKAQKVDQLIWAASKGDLGAVHRLIVRGYDQDAADYDGRTPLHLAAAEGREHVVRYFLENGVDVQGRDRWEGTALDDAHRSGHSGVVGLLEEYGALRGKEVALEKSGVSNQSDGLPYGDTGGIVEMIYAASEGDLPAIQRLVARGIDLGGADYDMRTPLHLAASEGHERIVQYLLDQGVEVAPRDRWGGTPLEDARRHGHSRVVQVLENQSGAVPNSAPMI